jgi:hypothetical protein
MYQFNDTPLDQSYSRQTDSYGESGDLFPPNYTQSHADWLLFNGTMEEIKKKRY